MNQPSATRGTLLDALRSPILLRGDENTAYRDPAVIFYRDRFYLYYTLVKTAQDGTVNLYTALSTTRDLQHFSEPQILTPKDQARNFSSPGNIIRFNGQWVMCLQTYPRPNGEKYGNASARIWLMRSSDLLHWSEPEIMMVKGNDTRIEEMGRMIDPYLLEDKDQPGKYWCFYKQNGVSMSYSYDLKTWRYYGCTNSGENVCVLIKDRRYLLFHSPRNGIGTMESDDLIHWKESGAVITLGQKNWPWARGRLTAGFVLDCRNNPEIGQYLMFFHGTGPDDEEVIFDTHACIGIAWSDDLIHWNYPK